MADEPTSVAETFATQRGLIAGMRKTLDLGSAIAPTELTELERVTELLAGALSRDQRPMKSRETVPA